MQLSHGSRITCNQEVRVRAISTATVLYLEPRTRHVVVHSNILFIAVTVNHLSARSIDFSGCLSGFPLVPLNVGSSKQCEPLSRRESGNTRHSERLLVPTGLLIPSDNLTGLSQSAPLSSRVLCLTGMEHPVKAAEPHRMVLHSRCVFKQCAQSLP